VEQHSELLLKDAVEEVLKANIAHAQQAGDQGSAQHLQAHLDVLRACRTEGIPAAFDRLEKRPNTDSTPFPFSPDLVPHAVAALRGGPAEKMAFANELATLASQTKDTGLRRLIEALQMALFGGNLDDLGKDLEGALSRRLGSRGARRPIVCGQPASD